MSSRIALLLLFESFLCTSYGKKGTFHKWVFHVSPQATMEKVHGIVAVLKLTIEITEARDSWCKVSPIKMSFMSKAESLSNQNLKGTTTTLKSSIQTCYSQALLRFISCQKARDPI